MRQVSCPMFTLKTVVSLRANSARSSIASIPPQVQSPLILANFLRKHFLFTVIGYQQCWALVRNGGAEFVVAIRGCRDSLRSCSRRFQVPWVHFRAVAQLDGRGLEIRRNEKQLRRRCKHCRSGLLELLQESLKRRHVVHCRVRCIRRALAVLRMNRWRYLRANGTMSPRASYGRYDWRVRAGYATFSDLSVVYTNASALSGSSERLRNLSRGAMFEACGCLPTVSIELLSGMPSTTTVLGSRRQ